MNKCLNQTTSERTIYDWTRSYSWKTYEHTSWCMYVYIYIYMNQRTSETNIFDITRSVFFDITRSDSWKIYGYESKFKCINETIIFCRFSGFNTLSNATEKTTSQRPKQPSQADPWGKIGLIAMTIPKLIVSNSQVEPWKIHLSHGQWNTGWLRLVSLCL